jgi:HK97 family phage prohead protease
VGEGVSPEFVERAVDESGDDEVSFPFVLSTSAEDRQHDVINQSGWRLENYRKNPVVLWAHDYGQLPVARASAVYVAGDKLKAVDRFTKEHDLARVCAALYRDGFLNAVSVGFRPIKWAWNEERGGMAADFEECELLEHSAVPVPAHQDALIEARAAGHDVAPVLKWAEQALEERGGLYLPKALLETALAKASTRIVVDLARDAGKISAKAVKASDDGEAATGVCPDCGHVGPLTDFVGSKSEKPRHVCPEPNLAKALDVVKGAGFAVLTPDALEALRPKAVEPAPAPAPAKEEQTPAKDAENKTAENVEEKKQAPAIALDRDAIKSEVRGLFEGAFLDPLRKFVTAKTGRLD